MEGIRQAYELLKILAQTGGYESLFATRNI